MRNRGYCEIAVERAHMKSLDTNDKLIQTRSHVRDTTARRKQQVRMRKVKSTIQPQRHFHGTDGFTQNRRQKVVSRGALRLCRGGLTFKLAKLHWFIKFHISILGLGALFGGDMPTKAPRGHGTGFTSQLVPHSLSPVLCLEFSEAWYIDWLIVLSNMMVARSWLRPWDQGLWSRFRVNF